MGDTQDRGNTRGCGFMSGQGADPRAGRGLEKPRWLSLQQDPPVRVISRRCMPDLFLKISSSRCSRTFPDLLVVDLPLHSHVFLRASVEPPHSFPDG